MTLVKCFLLSAVLLFACTDSTFVSNALCETPCYTGPENTVIHGECRAGKPICENKQLVACEGEVLPQTELCDGLDNDCDGQIDNLVQDRYIGFSCNDDILPFATGFRSQCKWGITTCRDAQLQCVGLVRPTNEVCDGIDNDCDGDIDNGLGASAICYSGLPSDLSHVNGVCRAGVVSCRLGRQVCVGEVTPTVEICDQLDNDCNGIVDDVFVEKPKPVDLVLLVDVSGSMIDKIEIIRTTLLALLKQYNDPLYRYALVYVPGILVDGEAQLILNLSTATTASIAIASLDVLGVGTELSYDAMMQAVTGELQLNYRWNARTVLAFFGDEESQTRRGYTEQEVTETLVEAGAMCYAFVLPLYNSEYDDITNSTGGRIFDLRLGATELYTAFEHVLHNGCIP